MGTHVKRSARDMEKLEQLASEFVHVGEGIEAGPQAEQAVARVKQIGAGLAAASKFARSMWKKQPMVVVGVGAGVAIGLGVLAGVMIYRARRA